MATSNRVNLTTRRTTTKNNTIESNPNKNVSSSIINNECSILVVEEDLEDTKLHSRQNQKWSETFRSCELVSKTKKIPWMLLCMLLLFLTTITCTYYSIFALFSTSYGYYYRNEKQQPNPTAKSHVTLSSIGYNPSNFIKKFNNIAPIPNIKPRIIRYYFDTVQSPSNIGIERIYPNLQLPITGREIIDVPLSVTIKQMHLLNSHDYRKGKPDPMIDGDCVPQHDWQTKFYPSCNVIHEQSLPLQVIDKSSKVSILANGYYRDVWRIYPDADVNNYGNSNNFTQPEQRPQPYALKTIRYEHEYTERNLDRHRRDAVAMERLTPSSNVLNMYAYCGHTGIFEFAPYGDLLERLTNHEKHPRKLTNQEKLQVAYQVITAVADVHNVDNAGRPSIVHADISLEQFVRTGAELRYKLNDFNRARFLLWNKKEKRNCGFFVGHNPGTFRAPEEYLYEEETEKIDIFSVGNIFYTILHEETPFDGAKEKKVIKRIKAGKRAPIDEKFLSSDDPYIQALIKSIKLCWIQDPTERATAREVVDYIYSELGRIS